MTPNDKGGVEGRRIRMPRAESQQWLKLGRSLDRIRIGIDSAISKGFVGKDGVLLENALLDIIEAAEIGLTLMSEKVNITIKNQKKSKSDPWIESVAKDHSKPEF